MGEHILTWARKTVKTVHLDQGTLLISLIRKPVGTCEGGN